MTSIKWPPPPPSLSTEMKLSMSIDLPHTHTKLPAKRALAVDYFIIFSGVL